MDVSQPTLFLAEFSLQVESLRERARTNTATTLEQGQDTRVIIPIEEQSSDFFVFISPQAQLLEQAAAAQEERQQQFGETTEREESVADEFVNVSTSVGFSRRIRGLTSEEAVSIYRFVDSLR